MAGWQGGSIGGQNTFCLAVFIVTPIHMCYQKILSYRSSDTTNSANSAEEHMIRNSIYGMSIETSTATAMSQNVAYELEKVDVRADSNNYEEIPGPADNPTYESVGPRRC